MQLNGNIDKSNTKEDFGKSFCNTGVCLRVSESKFIWKIIYSDRSCTMISVRQDGCNLKMTKMLFNWFCLSFFELYSTNAIVFRRPQICFSLYFVSNT
jgi:hypothetical protein